MESVNQRKGSLSGLLSGLFWGLDSVLLGIVLLSPVLIGLGSSASFVATFLHDSISFIILFILILSLKKISEFKKVLFSKSGLAIITAALLGGPLGMGAYILSIRYLGASIGAAGSAVYPAVGALLSYFFLKRTMKKHSIIGLVIAITAIALMSLNASSTSDNVFLGIVFLSLCVLGWGSEAVIIDATLKEDVSSEVALAIRQLTSMLVYGLVVMPLLGFSNIGPVLSSSSLLILITLTSLAGTVSYLAYYKSIDLIGATQAMGLNISYPAWAFVFQFLYDGSFDIKTFVLILFVMFGSILSNDNPKDLLKVFSFKKRAII